MAWTPRGHNRSDGFPGGPGSDGMKGEPGIDGPQDPTGLNGTDGMMALIKGEPGMKGMCVCVCTRARNSFLSLL